VSRQETREEEEETKQIPCKRAYGLKPRPEKCGRGGRAERRLAESVSGKKSHGEKRDR
jgi:hypothetical protein